MELAKNAMEGKIAESLRQIQADYYGLPPKDARCYLIEGELCVVVMEETFTPAEKTLITHGEQDEIQHIRRRFQQINADQFIAVVEQATGNQVRAFVSETNLGADVAIEVFLLGEKRADMHGFEDAAE